MAVILMILAFICWWPLGLVVLAFLMARGRFGHWRRPSFAGSGPMCDWDHNWDYHNGDRHMDRWEHRMVRMQEKMDRVRAKIERFKGHGDWWRPSSSGNRAFDEYRSETLKRLEEEQREFKEFLERLRFARDRSEFDQFMNERRNRPPEQPGPQPQA